MWPWAARRRQGSVPTDPTTRVSDAPIIGDANPRHDRVSAPWRLSCCNTKGGGSKTAPGFQLSTALQERNQQQYDVVFVEPEADKDRREWLPPYVPAQALKSGHDSQLHAASSNSTPPTITCTSFSPTARRHHRQGRPLSQLGAPTLDRLRRSRKLRGRGTRGVSVPRPAGNCARRGETLPARRPCSSPHEATPSRWRSGATTSAGMSSYLSDRITTTLESRSAPRPRRPRPAPTAAAGAAR